MLNHGGARRGQPSPEYRVWCDLIQRTTNPGCQQYARYGERGISVCDRWRKSFTEFLADVGRRPGPGYSLDRYPDQRGNYEPGNVRWATRTDQNRNRINVRVVTLDGITRTLPEWIAILGIPPSTVHSRLALGWSPEHALTMPSRGRSAAGRTIGKPRSTRVKTLNDANQTIHPDTLQPRRMPGGFKENLMPINPKKHPHGVKVSSVGDGTGNRCAHPPKRSILDEVFAHRSKAEMDELFRTIREDKSLPHPSVPVKESDTASAADFHLWMRSAAQVLSYFGHDTPERMAVMKAVGIHPAAFPEKYLPSIAEAILCAADRRHADEVIFFAYEGVYWERLPIPNDEPQPRSGLITRRLSEVIERKVAWLWPHRFPIGYLTLVSGDPGLGKTWLILDLFARITTGRGFPDGGPNYFGRKDGTQMGSDWSRRNVLWVSAEDADEDVIGPRFRMLGGEPTRFHSLKFVANREFDKACKRYEDREQTLDLSRHLEHLDNWLAAHPLVVAVGLDPLAAFLGKVDSHRNSDVRGLMTPLGKLAEKRRVAIIGNNHLHKGDSDNAMYRGMGSVAFVAAARSAWLVTKDPKEPKDRRLFTSVKNNLASEDVGGLAFRVGPAHGGFFWEEGRVETTADEALRIPDKETIAPQREEAKEWLRELLKGGPVLAADALEKAKADGMCEKTLKAAKKELAIRTEKTGGPGKPWVWSLPNG